MKLELNRMLNLHSETMTRMQNDHEKEMMGIQVCDIPYVGFWIKIITQLFLTIY